MAREKVFQAHMGFFDSVVAAPSQKAALEAWGTRQNLFAEGLAAPTDDPDAVKAAMARPGVVLKRAAGSKDPFQEDAAAPKAPAAPKRPKATGKAAAAAPPPPKPKPDRSELTAAERALEAAKQTQRRELEALEREQRALEAKQREIEDRGRAEARTLERAVDKARRAYERAGG